MALTVRIVPMAKSIAVTIRNDLSVENQKKYAAAFAQVGIDAAKDKNRQILGRVPPYTVTVDGVRGARLESVNPNGGNIIAEFELIEGLLRWIGEQLIDRSPFTSGAYQSGHTLMADGVEVIPGETIPVAEEYMFINLVPYARRLEIGKTKSGRPFLIQKPNRIYEHVAKDASRRFGNQAKISFGYRDLEPRLAYKLKHDQASRDFTSGKMRIRPGIRADRKKDSVVASPVIIVRHLKV